MMRFAHLNLDLERSRRFYREWLGFDGEEMVVEDGTLFLRNAEGFDLALHPGTPPRPPAPTIHFGLRFDAPDGVRALAARMVDAGVQLTETYDDEEYVTRKVLDPDGYEIELYWQRW